MRMTNLNGKLEGPDLSLGVRLSSIADGTMLLDRGVTVDEYLQTSVPRIFAAGDIARWPDRLTGERIRVEHFVVAECQGQTAVRNMIGQRKPFEAVPFFWTEQYDFSLAHVGHAERWDQVAIDGSLAMKNCTIVYRRDGRQLAAAFVRRDHDGLLAELAFEREMSRGMLPFAVAAPAAKATSENS